MSIYLLGSVTGFRRVSVNPLKLYEKCEMCVFLESIHGFNQILKGVCDSNKDKNH